MKLPAFEPINLKNDTIAELLLSQIIPDDKQNRKVFDKGSLEELAFSIKQHGIIQPVVVRETEEKERYQLIVGERRWRAAKLVGLERIPAIIKAYDKSARMAVALIENIQRKNLNPLEEAFAIHSLLVECSMTHDQVAESIGKSRTSVSNLVRLLNLEDEVKILVNSGSLEMGHARALLGLVGEQQVDLAHEIVHRKLSVRKTENLIQKIKDPSNQKLTFEPAEKEKIYRWSAKLSKKLSSPVRVYFNSKGEGRVVMKFESEEKLSWLIDRLTVQK